MEDNYYAYGDFDYEEYYPNFTSDPSFVACRESLIRFFRRKQTPFYLTQLEILFEKQYFHWITYRAGQHHLHHRWGEALGGDGAIEG